jgi:predicted hotdog family 3-hydroxylacyl-ACP dehydratase
MINIPDYLPHSGKMCLIDEIISIDELIINARSSSHQDKQNPLRFLDHLPAVSGIEYAAQTVALHLALTGKNTRANGFLASVQNCIMRVQHLDNINCPLAIACTQVHLDHSSGALYDFNISAEPGNILTGRLLIMFNKTEGVK